METVEYDIRGIRYIIQANKETHDRIEKDAAFMEQYIQQNRDPVKAPQSMQERDDDQASENMDFENERFLLERKQSFTWTMDNTLMLLREYGKLLDKFRDPHVKKRNLWRQIKQVFDATCSEYISEELLDRKYRNLKKTFIAIEENRVAAAAKGNELNIRWPYYQVFKSMFRNERVTKTRSNFMIGGPYKDSLAKIQPKQQPQTQNHIFVPLETNGMVGTHIVPAAKISYPAVAVSPSAALLDHFYTESPELSRSSQQDPEPQPSSSGLPETVDAEWLKEREEAANQKLKFRKRMVDLRQKEVDELKKIREAIEEGNALKKRRIELFERVLGTIEKDVGPNPDDTVESLL